VLTVVKVGGGLVREAGDDVLRALCEAIGEAASRHALLVVPGGAGFADAVRDHDARFGLRPVTAHAMAILAMEQFGLLLCDLIPRARPCATLAAGTSGGVPVLLPAAASAASGLPVSWEVTSDSIAARVAGAVNASGLVLVKPVAGLYRDWPPAGEPLKRLTVAELADLRAAGRAAGVDAHLPAALPAARVDAWVIDGREPRRLLALLEHGRAEGTLITQT
jgi:5-(aminomethyl)-3-furanmethanol phosphate kinase